MEELGVGRIASVMGRYYAMDRDNRWERVQKAYNAMVLGQGGHAACPYEAVKKSYEEGVTDEFDPLRGGGDGADRKRRLGGVL